MYAGRYEENLMPFMEAPAPLGDAIWHERTDARIFREMDVRGLRGPFTCLNAARYGIAWGALGAAGE